VKESFLTFCLICIACISFGQADTVYKKFKYPNGTISSEGYLVNGKPEGKWISYYPTGVKKSVCIRKNNLLDRTWIFFNEVGNLEKKIDYLRNKRNGYSITYQFNDRINRNIVVSKILYVNDIRQGKGLFYYNDGTLKEEAYYEDGQREGLALEYNKEGRVITEKIYKQGALLEINRVNRYNKNGKKDGIWRTYHDNGLVKKEIPYKNGLRDGFVREYEKDGKLESSIRYNEGNIDIHVEDEQVESILREIYSKDSVLLSKGPYIDDTRVGVHTFYDEQGEIMGHKIYDQEGNLLSEGFIDTAGRKQGEWKHYYKNGSVKSKGLYKNNYQHGNWEFYYVNGALEQSGMINEGKLEGTWEWFYPEGDRWKTENYYNGKLEGKYIEFNKEGEVIVEGEYFDGEEDGIWSVNVGDHVEKGKYINGLKEGEWIFYYPSGNVSFEGNYVQGVPDGKHEFYFPDGSLKEVRFYVMGYKEKNWKKYNNEGELYLTITYKNDKEYRINGRKIELETDVKKIR
jgi:antitoxin component YwqK of YwqJK toxin-antitoxin module